LLRDRSRRARADRSRNEHDVYDNDERSRVTCFVGGGVGASQPPQKKLVTCVGVTYAL